MKSLPTLAVLLLIAILVLFEALFLDASFLGLDNRMAPPFIVHRDPSEPPRAMNFATSDINGFVIPEAILQLDRIRAGEWPLWNPYQNGGQPLLADMGFATVYPTTLVYLMFPVLRAYAVSLLLHLVFLGLGTFLLLRRRGALPLSACFGAVSMALCGFVAVHLHLPNFLRAMAWLPWILIAADRLRERPGRGRVAVLAVLIGGCLLAGFPQVSLLALYAVIADFLWRLRGTPNAGRVFALGVLALFLGGMLGSIHLAPGLELHRESWRSGGLSDEQWSAKSLHPATLIGLVLPHFFGSPVQEFAPGQSVHDLDAYPSAARWLDDDVQNNFIENTTYVGLVPLVLALLVLTRRRRSGEMAAWLLLVATLALALGLPGVADVARWLPGVAAGSPKRVLFLTALALMWLAVSELDRLLREPRDGDRTRLLGAGIGLGAVGALAFLPWQHWLFEGDPVELLEWFRGALSGDATILLLMGAGVVGAGLLVRSKPRIAATLLIGLTAADLVWFARKSNPPQPLENQYAATPATDWLIAEGVGEQWRFITYRDDPVLGGSVAQALKLRAANGLAAMVDRETGEVLNVVDDAILDERDPRMMAAVKDPAALQSPLLDLLGVRYVVTSADGFLDLQNRLAELPGLELAHGSEPEMLAVFRRPSALPAAFAVTSLRAVPDRDERLRSLGDPAFEPAREAILEELPADWPALSSTPATVTARRPAPEHYQIEVEGEGPSFVVVSESHHPGWIATIDGESVPLVRANHAFLGIPVPAGSHTLDVTYRPASFRLGAALFAVSLLTIVVLSLWPRRRGRGVASSDGPTPGAAG